MKNLSPAQILALSKVLSDKKVEEAREAVGNSISLQVDPFDFSCQGGTISIGDPTEYTPTVHLPILDILVIALHKAGFQRDNILSLVTDAATDALNSDQRVGDVTKTDIDFVKKEVSNLQTSLATNLPKKIRSGTMKVNVKWS